MPKEHFNPSKQLDEQVLSDYVNYHDSMSPPKLRSAYGNLYWYSETSEQRPPSGQVFGPCREVDLFWRSFYCHFVPSSLAVVGRLAAIRSPLVRRFYCTYIEN